MTVHAKRGIFAYATEIAFLISFERAYIVVANGAIGSVIAVTDPKLRHFETEPLPNSICKTALLPFIIIITDISQFSISDMHLFQSMIKSVYVMGQVFPCSSLGGLSSQHV